MPRLRRRPSRRRPGEIEELLLRQLEAADRPLSVYDLNGLVTRSGESMAPMQIYRSLGRLAKRGEVHRIESLSAYVRRTAEIDCVSICGLCDGITLHRDPSLADRFERAASLVGFRSERLVVEVVGICARCVRTRGGRHGGSA